MEKPIAALTIGFPFFNEGQTLAPFLARLAAAAEIIRREQGIDCRVLAVDDGSTDGSGDVFRSTQTPGLPKTMIRLARNFGHSAAVKCLLDSAEGDLVLMDADFQDNPDDLPALVKCAAETGADAVRVMRSRRSEPLTFRAAYWIFSRVYRWSSGLEMGYGTFGLYRQSLLERLRTYPEMHRYWPGLVSLVGLRQEVLVRPRGERPGGGSRVGFRRLVRLGLDAWLSFGTLPIRVIMGIGGVVMLIAFAGAIAIFSIKLLTRLAIPGWASILTSIYFLSGIQILMLAVLGEYLARIYQESKHRPLYHVWSVERDL